MKKIINNKQYNTETAKMLGRVTHGNYGDLNCTSEELYRKKTGEFFLYGEGGPATKYSVSVGNNNWSGGCDIIPLTYESAQKWAEENLSAELYESIFGDVSEENGVKQTYTISISTAVMEKIRREAAKEGIGISSYIEKKCSI